MPEDGALELREFRSRKCPRRHFDNIQRILFEWDAEEKRWYIVARWYLCPVCSKRLIEDGRHVWPSTIDEAFADYETRLRQDSDFMTSQPHRVLDRA